MRPHGTNVSVPNSSSLAGPTGNALARPGTSAVEKARKMSPEKWLPAVPVRARPKRNAPCQSLALARQQRRVGGHDRDDRAGAGRRLEAEVDLEPIVGQWVVVEQLGADTTSGNGQFDAGAEVRLHERCQP